MSFVDPAAFRPGIVLIGLIVASAYDITRWMAHCTKSGYEPWNVEKGLRTIQIGVLLGMMAAAIDHDATPISEPILYFAAIPLVDECVRWMKELRRREIEREYVVSSRDGEGGVESVKQAYVEGDVTLLEFEDQVEEEIELEGP